MEKPGERFQPVSARYAQFRPLYPDAIVNAIADRLKATPMTPGSAVIDVGSGTGIFTRQLAAALPPATPIVGIEPSTNMRKQAEAFTPLPSVSYRDGLAERLPVGDQEARGVVAATAAHWFDRPSFYHEAKRVLAPGGILAVAEYVKDENSPAARAAIDFLDRYGNARAYTRPDYVAELSYLSGFTGVEQVQEAATLRLSPEAFAGLALSSSHARKAIEELGETKASARLIRIAAGLVEADGAVPFGYVFRAFLARRV